MERTRKEFDELEERERESFDRDRLDNLYPGSRILQGDPDTGLAKELFEKFAQSTDISTVLGTHLSEEPLEEAEKQHLSVVIADHIASDNLGMNLPLDRAPDPGVEVLKARGFRRMDR